MENNAKEMELQRMAREAKNAYRREWLKKHPGKSSEYAANYWIKKVREKENNMNENEMEIERKAREAKNAYRREFIKKHPGKSTEYANNYWLKKIKLLDNPNEEQN